MKQKSELSPEAKAGTQKTRESFVATHEGTFLGFVPILWNEEDYSIMGKTPFWDALIVPISHAWNCLAVAAAYVFPGFSNPGWPMRLREIDAEQAKEAMLEDR